LVRWAQHLEDNETMKGGVEVVTEIMDLYRQAAEKFSLAGDQRHEQVMEHMAKFLQKEAVIKILDGTKAKAKDDEQEEEEEEEEEPIAAAEPLMPPTPPPQQPPVKPKFTLGDIIPGERAKFGRKVRSEAKRS